MKSPTIHPLHFHSESHVGPCLRTAMASVVFNLKRQHVSFQMRAKKLHAVVACNAPRPVRRFALLQIENDRPAHALARTSDLKVDCRKTVHFGVPSSVKSRTCRWFFRGLADCEGTG